MAGHDYTMQSEPPLVKTGLTENVSKLDSKFKRFAPQHFENPHVGMWQKILLFNAIVVLNTLYACETWDYTPWDIHAPAGRPTPGFDSNRKGRTLATCIPNQVPLVWPIHKIFEEITTVGANISTLPNSSGKISRRCSRGGGGYANNNFAQ